MARPRRRNIFVNFKTYRQGSASSAEAMARKISSASGGHAIIIVQNADIYRVSKVVKATIFAQHVDAAGYGQFTGSDVAATLKENGASGVLINHSEDRARKISDIIKASKAAGLTALVCAEKPSEAALIARMHPDIIAIEPPELIGTGISVSKAKPHVVTAAVNAVRKVDKNMPVLCGAGITTSEDVRKAVKLGCSGVLVASAIMKAKTPEKVVKEFVAALR